GPVWKEAPDRRKEPLHLSRCQHRRRASADKDGADGTRGHVPHPHRHLPLQRRQVFIHRLPLHHISGEVAVVAFVGTKGNVDIDCTGGHRLPSFPSGRRRKPLHFLLLSSTFSTAMKASWGTSTFPTAFIRFFPSFCFSSSFRFRLTSPPYHLAKTFFRIARTVSRAITLLPMAA